MNRIKKFIISILILIALFININVDYTLAMGNDENRNFKRITTDDGLSQSSVTKIFQDSKGYMWIGTRDGLNKYNGHKFEIYKYNDEGPNSIIGNSITAINEDKYGNLWVGTSTGLSKISANTKKATHYLPSKNGCNISNYRIRDILVSKNGSILVATDDGLNKYDYENDNFIRIYNGEGAKSLSNQIVYSLEEDDKNYWVGTKSGLNKINKSTNEITKYYSSKEENTLSSSWVYKLHLDDKGYLWVGTYYGGLNRINLDTGKIDIYTLGNTNIPGAYIRDVLRDSRGLVWVATDYGFAKLDEVTNKFTVYKARPYDKKSICNDDVMSIYESKSGNIWIGTYGGINLFNPANLFEHYKNDPLDPNSFSENSISGIYKDNEGILWVGTVHNGINIFDREKDEVTRLNTKYKDEDKRISDNYIRKVVGIDNEIWIATQDGLNKYDKLTNKVTVYRNIEGLAANDILSLYIDKEGILWIGTRDGVSSFDRKNKFTDYTELFAQNGISKSQIFDIHEDENNILWFSAGVENGLVKYDRNKNKVESYTNKNKNKNYNLVLSINSDINGNLWLGTDYGLIKFDTNNYTYERYTEKDGLANNFVYSVLLDNDENIWVSTNYGISKYDIKDKRFINFDSADGLQDNEFNQHSYYKSEDGEMFFGGIDGLTSFNPKNINEKKYIPSVEIEDLIGNDKNIVIEDTINLSYKYNKLQFNFFMPDYGDTKKIQYAYKLSGVDKNWTFADQRNYANYTNLKSGSYNFQVTGRNSSGIWSKPSSITINISNPPWESPVAYVLYIVVISGIIYLIYNRVKLLDKLVNQRTLELDKKLIENKDLYSQLLKHEKYKNNYFTNLSHELKTPLNVIVSTQKLIENLNKKKENIPKDKISYYMNTMDRNCKRLSNLIDNIIYTSKIELGSYELNIKENDIVSLVEDAVLSMKNEIESSHIELIFDTNVEEQIIECDELEIRRSIINIMSNAIKFTEAKGKIEARITYLDHYVKISIKDTGIGIDKKQQESIFNRFNQDYKDSSEEHGGKGLGLTLTRQLIELHNGHIWVRSELGSGSEFNILLPVKQSLDKSS